MLRRLPDDVIDDILVWLSVKDLLRFRCLSKSACTTIDSPAFVAAHLNRSRQTKSQRKLVFLGTIHSFEEHNYNGIDLDDDEIHRGLQLSNPLESFQVVNGNSCDYNRILASCNGSLLLYSKKPKSGSALWNPFTRRWKTVPLRSYGLSASIGLGYDSATNDYKVVGVGQVGPLRFPLGIEVEVFHVSSNTLTKQQVVSVPFPEDRVGVVKFTTMGVFAKGALHWIIACSDYEEILSFNIATQNFVKMLPPLPPEPRRGYYSSFTLQGLGEELFLSGRKTTFGQRLMESESELELFELVDNDELEGNGSVWGKLCSMNPMELNRRIGRSGKFPPILEDVKLLEYSKEGNKILLQYPARASGHTANGSPYLSHLFWYDFVRGTYNRYLRSRCEASFCLESLVSLGADAQFDGSNLVFDV